MGGWKSWGTVATAGEGEDAEKSREVPLPEGSLSCFHSLCGPLFCRKQTSAPPFCCETGYLGLSCIPQIMISHPKPLTRDHSRIDRPSASLLDPPKMRELRDPGSLRMPGTDAYRDVGTRKGWSRWGVVG